MNNFEQCQKIINSGDFEIAYNVCTAALEVDDTDHQAWYLLSILGLRMNFHVEAKDFIDTALKLFPSCVDYIFQKAVVLFRSALFDEMKGLILENICYFDIKIIKELFVVFQGCEEIIGLEWFDRVMADFYELASDNTSLGMYSLVSVSAFDTFSVFEEWSEEVSWPVSPLDLKGFVYNSYPVFSQNTYPQYYAEINGGFVVSGLDAVFDERNKQMLSDELSLHLNDLNKVWFYKNIEFFKENIVFACASKKPCLKVKNAISFFGSCNFNYAHWLFEKLPKFYWVDKLNLPDDTLLLLEEGVPQSVLDSLYLFWPKDRVLVVKPGRRVNVERLFFVSNSLEFFEPIPGYEFKGNEFRIYPKAFKWLADTLKSNCVAGLGEKKLPFIYLPRQVGSPRSIVNQKELQNELVNVGCEVFDPAGASFIEQVNTFARTKLLIGASGAGMANLLFMPADSHAVIICHDTPQMPMWFFHSVAQAVGVNLHFVAAKGVEKTGVQEMHYQVEVDVLHTRELLKSYMRQADVDQRVAFLLVHEDLINHFSPVWQQMEQGRYCAVLYGEEAETSLMSSRLDAIGVPYKTAKECLARAEKFAVMVSNHPIDASGEMPLIRRLALRNIRFMYAAGKGAWNFSQWNELYDVIMTMGPSQQKALSHFRRTTLLPMGWPRMDRYFTQDWDMTTLQKDFACDPQRKTIVWLPTWTEISSVSFYAQAMADLCGQYNVVVKLHPLYQKHDPEGVKALQSMGFNAVLAGSEDNVPLLRLADWIFADYGGSLFAAMYVGKPLLLLDVPDSSLHWTMGEESPDLLVRETLLHIDPASAHTIPQLLEDAQLWQQQQEKAQQIIAQYIYPFKGCAATLLASYLSNPELILR